jgi:hypothetical protein
VICLFDRVGRRDMEAKEDVEIELQQLQHALFPQL